MIHSNKRTTDEIVRGGIRKDIHFCAGGSGKDTCQVRLFWRILFYYFNERFKLCKNYLG